jgi:hypothetical protein
MTKREVCRLSCRVLSIYNLTNFFLLLNVPVAMLQTTMITHSSTLPWLLSLILPVLVLLLSAFLWFGAEALSARMISGAESSESASGVTSEVIQRLAFAVVGLLILVGAISPLERLIQDTFHPIPDPRSPIDEWNLARLAVEVVIRLALGVWLLFGAEGLSRLLQKAKPLVNKDW